ncbi:putative aaa atpase [Anaeramoeba flamelloides]|uniref:Aaa atpase n=1 Tax=Anaeramoeba flamelloides TaxID=1746091 RepID=A0AAV7Z7Z3_9EUKA|nr:putative aaa atpase [Anaeramoeba flamelloides]
MYKPYSLPKKRFSLNHFGRDKNFLLTDQLSMKRQRLKNGNPTEKVQHSFYKPGGINLENLSTQKELLHPKYGRLYSLYGNRSFVPISKLPFFFGSHPHLNFRLYGQEGEFSLSLASISVDPISRNRYLRALGQEGKVYLNGNLLIKGYKIILKDGDNLEFLGDYGKRYSFIFLSELFLKKQQTNLHDHKQQQQQKNLKQGSLQKQKRLNNLKFLINSNHTRKIKTQPKSKLFLQKNIRGYTRSEFEYLQNSEPKKQFCCQIIRTKNKDLIKHQTQIKKTKFLEIKDFIPKTLPKLLRMIIKVNFNPKHDLKGLNNNRKLFFIGKSNSSFIQEKICKSLSNEFNFQFFKYNFQEYLPLLSLFQIFKNNKTHYNNENTLVDNKEDQERKQNDNSRGIEKEKEQEKEKEKEKEKQKKREKEQEKESEQENMSQNEREFDFSIGDRVMYIGPDFQKFDSDRLIRSLLHNSHQKSLRKNKNSTLLSGPKPGSLGTIVMKYPTESCYSSPYLGLKFDEPVANVGCDLGLNLKDKGFFVKKGEILKLSKQLNADLPVIFCKEFFKSLKKIKNPFLLFIPNFDQSVFYSYHILETLKMEIDYLVDNNPNAFIISGIETGKQKLSRTESISLLKSIEKKRQILKLQNGKKKESRGSKPIFEGEHQGHMQLQHEKTKYDRKDDEFDEYTKTNHKTKNNTNKFFKVIQKEQSIQKRVHNNNQENHNKNQNGYHNNVLLPNKKFIKKIQESCDQRSIKFFSKFLGQTIYIQKQKNKRNLKKRKNFIRSEKKNFVFEQNRFLLKFLSKTKKLKLNFSLRDCNSFFPNKILNFEEIDSIIAHAMTNSIRNNFKSDHFIYNNNIKNEIINERNENDKKGNENRGDLKNIWDKKEKKNNCKIIINESDLFYGIKIFKNTMLFGNNNKNNNNNNDNNNDNKNKNKKNNYNNNNNNNVNFLNEKKSNQLKGLTNLEQLIYQQAIIPNNRINISFKDVGGLENIKKQIVEYLITPLNRPELYHRGNLNVHNSCKGVLLYGPSGSGKTVLAQAIIKGLSKNQKNEITVFKISSSLIYSKWHGNAEKNVKSIFSLVKKCAPSVLYIDEVDFLFSKRKNIQIENETNSKIKTLFMQNWKELKNDHLKNSHVKINEKKNQGNWYGECRENKNVIIIGVTNRPYDLDEAIIRRFEKQFYIPLPNFEQRIEILKVLLKHEKLESNFNFRQLAKLTVNYSGSDLKNLVKAALYIPIYEQLKKEKNLILQANGVAEERCQGNFEKPSSSGFQRNMKKISKDNTITLRELKFGDFQRQVNLIKSSVKLNSINSKQLKKWYSCYKEINFLTNNNENKYL